MEPLVSILIPAYNAGAWIAETIRSALDQTWPNKEIIVVDDGSTDQTLAVARQFISPTVKVVTQPNQGAAAARNHAFSLSRGDYIQWLDADDLLAPDKITRQMAAASQTPNKRMLYSGAWGKFFYRPRKASFIPSPLWSDLTPVEWLSRKMGQNCHMQTATWLVSRELTEKAGPWNTQLLGDDDGEYFCRVKLASAGIKFIPEARVYYRVTDTSRLSYIGNSNRKLDAQFQSIKLHIGYLRSLEDSERTRAACVRYLQQYMFHFYPERLDVVEQMQRLAGELGGRLETPRASWKYAWIQHTFGWSAAKQTQVQYNKCKARCLKTWDNVMSHLER